MQYNTTQQVLSVRPLLFVQIMQDVVVTCELTDLNFTVTLIPCFSLLIIERVHISAIYHLFVHQLKRKRGNEG